MQLVSCITRLDLTNKENMSLFECKQAVESKLETSRTSILFPIVSVLRIIKCEKYNRIDKLILIKCAKPGLFLFVFVLSK